MTSDAVIRAVAASSLLDFTDRPEYDAALDAGPRVGRHFLFV